MIRGMKEIGMDLSRCGLDSGADCHVLPLSFYSEESGTTELPELRMMFTDAQGNAIRTTENKSKHYV